MSRDTGVSPQLAVQETNQLCPSTRNHMQPRMGNKTIFTLLYLKNNKNV